MMREELTQLRNHNHELVMKMMEKKEDGGVDQLLKYKEVLDGLGSVAAQPTCE